MQRIFTQTSVFLALCCFLLPDLVQGQDLQRIPDPAFRMQVQNALKTMRTQLADMPAFAETYSAAKFSADDSLELGGIAGSIRGITENDSAWVLAVAAHLFEDPTAWALGTVEADGAFIITGLKRGTYILMAGAPGYMSQFFRHGYTIWEAEPLDVHPPEITHGIEFFLEPMEAGSGSISGTVFDEVSQAPIPGASVSAFLIDNPFVGVHTYTADDGSYTLPDLRAGTYQLTVYAEGYFEEGFVDEAGRGGTRVTIGVDEQVSGIDFYLNPGGSIAGRIVDGDGAPIAGASIQVFPPSDYEPYPDVPHYYGWAVSDEEGNYTVSGLIDGEYIVSAQVYDTWFTVTQWYDNADRREDATPVNVTFGEMTSGIDFTVDITTEVGSLSGRVVTEDGAPIRDGWIRLESIDRPNFYYYVTAHPDENGAYEFTDVPVGSYRVVLEYWTQWFYRILWFDGATNPADATPVEIVADQPTEGIDFTIEVPDGMLTGVVTDEAGKPVHNAYIQVNSVGYGQAL